MKQNNTNNTASTAPSRIAQRRKSSDQVSTNDANTEQVDHPDKTNRDGFDNISTPTRSMSRSPELSKKEPVKFPDFEASAVREEFFIARDPFSYNNASMLFSVLPSNNYYPPPESAYPYAISTPPPIPDNWVICFEQPGIERLHTFSLSNSMAPDIEGSMFTPEYFGTTQHINPRQISHGYPEPPSDVPMSNKTMVSFGADKDKEGLAFMNPIMEDQSMEPDSFLWGVDLSITQKHVTIRGTADMGSVEVDGSGGSLSRTHTQSVSKSLSRNGDNRMQTILQTASTQNKALMEQPAGMLEEMSNPNSPPDLSNMSEFEPAISSLPSPRGSKHDSSTNLAGAAAQGENSVPTTYKNFATQNIPLRQRNRNKKGRYLCTFEGCQEKKNGFERKCELTYHMCVLSLFPSSRG